MTAFTLFHVVLSLVGIVSGFIVLAGWLTGSSWKAWTLVFLSTTVATSVTGFLFPFVRFTPAYGVGIISIIVLGIAIYALYSKRLEGRWRTTYVVTAALAQYLNVFVLIVQAFLKVPALKAIAPTQNEPPFVIAQAATLLLFIAITIAATLRFRVPAVRLA